MMIVLQQVRLFQGSSKISVGSTACKVLGEHWSVSLCPLSRLLIIWIFSSCTGMQASCWHSHPSFQNSLGNSAPQLFHNW